MANLADTHAAPASEESISELVKQLTEQTSRLARQEIELAKAELAIKGKRAGIGAGMFGGSAMLGFYAVGALVAAAVLDIFDLPELEICPWALREGVILERLDQISFLG